MTIRIIDLFAGIGGIRLGFEQAAHNRGFETKCVLTSEIKSYAVDVLKQNHEGEEVCGDITQIRTSEIPEFDVLLAGFPCQAFSAAGKRLGFLDTRGTLFFEVERILRDKQPKGFILENVEGLVNHDKVDKDEQYGRTLKTILNSLDSLGYKISWRVLNSCDFGLPQERKRIYIVGTKSEAPDLDNWVRTKAVLESVLEHGLPTNRSNFIDKLLENFTPQQLYGKSLKDKRGGEKNIHSWDLEIKGEVSAEQKKLLNVLFKQRRKKQWAEEFGIDWMDGMPLTLAQIETFFPNENLEGMLEDLCVKGYLVKEHPKALVEVQDLFGNVKKERRQDRRLPLGYNIVTGKLSFEVGKILDPQDVAPTLVATDMQRLYVVDGEGLRKLSLREGLRLFGYPDDYKFNVSESDGYDLLGNTVCVPVIRSVAERLLDKIYPIQNKNKKMEAADILFQKLTEDFGFVETTGEITFKLNSFKIKVEQNNVVGNILEEWLDKWMTKKKIPHIHNPKQASPDFWLNPDNLATDWLEVKSFTGSPNFDLAAFRSFINLIIDEPQKLHSKHLLIKYKMEDGVITIENCWLKNLWEISSSSGVWPVKVQYKNKVIQNLRPSAWYSDNSDYPSFECLEDFLAAVEETVYLYHDTRNMAENWLPRLKASYKRFYGIELNVPRWMDVKHKYVKENV